MGQEMGSLRNSLEGAFQSVIDTLAGVCVFVIIAAIVGICIYGLTRPFSKKPPDITSHQHRGAA
jgi:hypothetical protein